MDSVPGLYEQLVTREIKRSLESLNPAQVADSKVICLIGHCDMGGRNVQGFVLAEKTDSLRLQEMGADGIDRHRISSNDQSFILPDIPPVEKVRSPPVKLRCEATENIQTRLSFYDGVSPNFTQR